MSENDLERKQKLRIKNVLFGEMRKNRVEQIEDLRDIVLTVEGGKSALI